MWKKSPVLRHFLVSYLVIASIPVLCMAFVFYRLYGSGLRSGVEQSGLASMAQVRASMDNLISDCSKVLLENSLHWDAVSVLARDNNEAEIQERIAACESSLRFPAQILLYENGEKHVYINRGRTLYSVFEGTVPSGADLTRSRFYYSLNSVAEFTILPIQAQTDGGEIGLIAFLYPLTQGLGERKATVAFLVRTEALSALLGEYLYPAGGRLFLLLGDRQLLFAQGGAQGSEALIDALQKARGTGVSRLPQEAGGGVLLRTVSEETGLVFNYVAPAAVFYAQIDKTQNWMFALCATMLALGFFVSLAFALYNYKPVRRLLQLSDTGGGRNEFEAISDTIRRRQEENRTLALQIQNQRPMIYQQFFSRLLRGRFQDEADMLYHMQCAGIRFEEESFFVVVVCPPPRGNLDGVLQQEEFLVGGMMGYGVRLLQENDLAVLFCIPWPEDGDAARRSAADGVRRALGDAAGGGLIVGVGGLYKSALRMDTSLLEAYAAIRLDSGDAGIAVYTPTVERCREMYVHPTHEYELYAQAVHHGNSAVALEALHSMLRSVCETACSRLILQSLCFDLINTAVRILGGYGLAIEMAEFQRMALISGADAFLEQLSGFTENACRMVRDQRSAHMRHTKEQIIEFVGGEFARPEMSLDYVADRFSISVSFLSRLFKEETGESFNQYVILLRMKKAKQLLRQSDMNIREIVRAVGYMDLASFSRRFKSMEGVPPGEYRRQAR